MKDYKVWRSKDTAIISSNFPADPKPIKEETTFNVNGSTSSPNARKLRMEKLVCVDYKRKLTAATGKTIEGETVDVLNNKKAATVA